MSTPPYVELHCHSAYSFLDGASLPDELAERARELGHAALAVTDHNSVSGAMELAHAAPPLGLRAVHGAEIDLRDGRHVTLLVRNGRGWRNLCRLLTLAHAHDRDRPSTQPGPGDRDPGSPSAPLHHRGPGEPPTAAAVDDVLDHADGLLCLTGCAERGVHDEPTARRLLDAFGPDDVRVELQRPYARHDRARNRALERLARRLRVPTVATGNVHAHTPARAVLQDALVAVRHHLPLDACEPLRRPNHTHVLATPAGMAARFADHPDAVAETVRVAERLEFDLTRDLGYRYPGCDDPAATRRLAERCHAAFAARYPRASPHHDAAAARLQEELRVIDSLGLAGFFLLHHDMLELARDVAREVRGPDCARALLPPGRGRGSSVSSIVCYLTGLSHIDPIANDLLLGRFLHEDLHALPDIDIDFPRDIRERLIPRVHDRYGREHSALVAAFPTYRARGAIRELGRALGLPPGEIERVARGSDGHGRGDGVSRDIAAALGPRRLADGRGRWAWLARLADEAHGLPRHLSQHPGGIVVCTRPLIDCCPVVPAATDGRQIVQWDKDSCADAGFLKIDLLGLGMLSAVERCVELIARTRRERVDLSRIPFDDPATFAAIQAADTVGVFQIESRAQIASLRRTRPETLQDLTIQVAIVRPGPIVGGAVNPYLKRRQRLREDLGFQIPYDHPSLEGPLRCTLGTIIFQDQVIEVARAYAGFTAGEAESLRRAMSRKRSDEAIERHHRRFVDGALRTHPDTDPACAERVFAMIRGFSGFGFPKAHGAAFGLLAYQSTWLRVHHPSEFLCALLNEQPMGFYPPDALIHEAQRRDVAILPPDVNASDVDCTVVADRGVRIGLGYVKDVSRSAVDALVAARARDGRFRTIADLVSRAGIDRPTLQQLAWAGAIPAELLAGGDLRSNGPQHARRAALWQTGVAVPGRSAGPGATQLALDLELAPTPALPALGDWDAMVADYATTGLSVDRHPLALLRPALTDRRAVTTADLDRIAHGAEVVVGGLVIARQRPQTAGGITFLLIEDEHGTVNLIVPPPVYDRDRPAVRAEPLILACGRLERHPAGAGAVNVLVAGVVGLRYDGGGQTVADVTPLAPAVPGTDQSQSGQRAGARGGAGADAKQPIAAEHPAAEQQLAATGTDDFHAVAPPAMSFAQGRRR